MRIKRISIRKYKNLLNFECEFSASNISAFIGSNGSGKSNLLEVITKAFSNAKNYAAGKDLPLSLDPTLDCIIEYELHGTDYALQYNHDTEGILIKISEKASAPIRDEISICCGEKILAQKDIDNALPDSILLYYAGETLRQKGAAESTYDSFYEEKLKRAKSAALPSLRFIDYYSIGDLPLLLLTAAAYRGDYYAKFLSFVNCSGVSPKFSLILRNPGKGKEGADTYWNATGFVKCFLDSARRFVTGTRDSDGHQYYMFFDGPEKFRTISENEFDLFAKLKALRHYGYLEHIGIELIKKDGKAIYPESETYNRALNEIMFEQMDVTMHDPEVEELYDQFKECIATHNKSAAEEIQQQLVERLHSKDPLLLKLRITLRRL